MAILRCMTEISYSIAVPDEPVQPSPWEFVRGTSATYIQEHIAATPEGRVPFLLHMHQHPSGSPPDRATIQEYIADPQRVGTEDSPAFYRDIVRRTRDLGGRAVRIRLLPDDAVQAEADLRMLQGSVTAGQEIWCGSHEGYYDYLNELGGYGDVMLRASPYGFYACGWQSLQGGTPVLRSAIWQEYPDHQTFSGFALSMEACSPLQQARAGFWLRELLLAAEPDILQAPEASGRLVPYDEALRQARTAMADDSIN